MTLQLSNSPSIEIFIRKRFMPVRQGMFLMPLRIKCHFMSLRGVWHHEFWGYDHGCSIIALQDLSIFWAREQAPPSTQEVSGFEVLISLNSELKCCNELLLVLAIQKTGFHCMLVDKTLDLVPIPQQILSEVKWRYLWQQRRPGS